jgi:hypothetical protein
VPFLGADELAKLAGQPQRIDAYIAAKTAEGLSPKTIANHLIELNVVFKVAQRWRLTDANPMRLVDRPRVEAPEMNVLSEGGSPPSSPPIASSSSTPIRRSLSGGGSLDESSRSRSGQRAAAVSFSGSPGAM